MLTIAALLLLSDTAGSPPRLLVDGVDPIAIFDTGCKGATVRLNPDAKQVGFAQLPFGAKAVIAHTLDWMPGSSAYPETPLAKDMPNPIFKLDRKGEAFLITTTAEPMPHARFGDSCMVVWKSDDFIAAHDYILHGVKSPLPWSTIKGFGFTRIDDGAYDITGATRDQWTVLKSDLSRGDPVAANDKVPGAKKQ